MKSVDTTVQHIGFPESFLSDTSSVKSPFAKFGGKNPTDRAKNGIKKGLVIDWNKIILSILIAPTNKHDSRLFLPHLGLLKRFLEEPKVMATDSAWDSDKLRKDLARENIALFAATNVRRNKSKRKIKPWGAGKLSRFLAFNSGIAA